MPILEIKNLIKKYHTKNVIDNISLNVDSGKIVGLLGPNGSGKTTLIKLLAGLLTATSGDILIDNKEIGIETKAIVSFLPDRPYFANWMKVHDILAFFADFYRDFSMKKAMEMLKEHYGLLSFMKLIAGTTKYESFIRKFAEDDFIKATTEYFQFPQDDEIEV